MNRDTGIGTEAQQQGHRNWDMDRKRMGQEHRQGQMDTDRRTGTVVAIVCKELSTVK